MPNQPVSDPPQHREPLTASAAADSLAPQPPSTNLESDITDELTDHLALAARDLQLAGHPADEAHKIAHQKFGDVAAIRRRLWWIQRGDEVMLRTAFAIVMVVLILAVAALGIGGWRISQTMNELGDTLVTMNETQRALLASREKEDRPLAIRGRLYLGEKSKPASYASVDVYSLPEGKKVNTLMADEDGRFGTSSLEAGHYTLLAKLIPSDDDRDTPSYLVPDFYAIQSRPISVYPWSKDTTMELDVAMVGYGQVSFELTKPLPKEIRIESPNNPDLVANIYPAIALVIPVTSHPLPIESLSDSQRIHWPVIGPVEHFNHTVEDDVQLDSTTLAVSHPAGDKQSPPANEPLIFWRAPTTNRPDVFRAGEYHAGAYITFHISIVGKGPVLDQPLDHLVGAKLDALPPKSKIAIQVVDGRRTHLKITPPDDLERLLREEIASVLGDEEKLSVEQQKLRPIKIEVAGQLDLSDPEKFLPRRDGGGLGGFGGAF